ncbi:hypothetical protein [Streptomyces avidinii]|uniref:Uncharacterized protein n=1 Tax=Streptomyces avidinii TaxID=1895 RepID=A0ABS4L1J2_STRAV|nr:hypothetical protein [Streptomyces avidinii]MBP2035481.1 hypothetical protein [Streptomyces avidinii]GGZ02178.1 hypothetical protein GCM10010343_29770 [Streptomyces avidinii]
MNQEPSWACKAIGFRGTPAGDIPLLVFTREGRDDRSVHEQLTKMGLAPFTGVVEDLLRPVPSWSADVENSVVVVIYRGAEFYRSPPGLVPDSWTTMAHATGRVVLVWLPGPHRPDEQQVLLLLRQGAGLWGTAALLGP